MAGSEVSRCFGLVLIAGAAAWAWQQLRVRRLVLVSGGGETVALTSKDAAQAESICAAIATAIAQR